MPTKFSVDPELIKQLAQVLQETGLGEIEYADGDRRIRIARPAVAQVAQVAAAPAPAAPAAAGGRPQAEAAPANAVLSPMVGTAYLSPSPGAAPFIKVGDRINEGQTLLIVEAMKVMNPIKAARGGVVREIMVSNGAPIEFGEPLLILD